MTNSEDPEFPAHLLFDIENQIWYEPLGDGTIRAGFTRWAANLMVSGRRARTITMNAEGLRVNRHFRPVTCSDLARRNDA